MNLFLFVIGMLAAAIATIVATLVLGGSVMLALTMGFVTLVVAQLLYVLLLLITARMSGTKKQADWAETHKQSRTKA